MKRFTATVAMIAAVGMLAGCSGAASGSGTDPGSTDSGWEEMKLTLSEQWPENSAGGIAAKAFMDFITENTDGNVTFEPFWQSSLLTGVDALEGFGSGTADVGFLATQAAPDQLPISNWLLQAGGLGTDSYPHGPLESNGSAIETVAASEVLQEEFAANNVKPLFMGSSLPSDFFCTGLLDSADTAAGKNIASAGPVLRLQVESLGAVPVTIPSAEAYEALQRGLLDCASSPSGGAFYPPFGIPEVAPYYTGARGVTAYSGSGYVINLDRWDSFAEELREVFLEAAAVYATEYLRANFEAYANLAENDDVEFVDVGAVNEILEPFQEGLIEDMPSTAPSTLTDADATLDQVLENFGTWEDAVAGFVSVEPEEQVTGDEVRAAYVGAVDAVDWDAYRDAITAAILQR